MSLAPNTVERSAARKGLLQENRLHAIPLYLPTLSSCRRVLATSNGWQHTASIRPPTEPANIFTAGVALLPGFFAAAAGAGAGAGAAGAAAATGAGARAAAGAGAGAGAAAIVWTTTMGRKERSAPEVAVRKPTTGHLVQARSRVAHSARLKRGCAAEAADRVSQKPHAKNSG